MLLSAADGLLEQVRDLLKTKLYEHSRIWQVVADANRYVDSSAPWALKKMIQLGCQKCAWQNHPANCHFGSAGYATICSHDS